MSPMNNCLHLPMKIRAFSSFCLVLMSVAAFAATQADSDTLLSLARKLAATKAVCGTVEYEVYIPSSADPVKYDIRLTELPAPGDTLCPCDYIIDWTLHHDDNSSQGFSAYHAGNHYRYSNHRLSEYHYVSDPVPFSLGGGAKGVQNAVQFASLLPAFMARTLDELACDTSYIYTLRKIDSRNIRIDGVKRSKGFDALEYEYLLDAETGLPVEMDLVYNPSSISEQTVSAKFRWNMAPAPESINEALLLERYPEVFDKYRTSDFKVTNLPGTLLPGFSAPTATRERYSRNRGDNFRAPTLLLFLDPEAGNPADVVRKTRLAVDELPMQVDVIYLFADHDAEAAEHVVGPIREGEHLLISARSLMRDLGVAETPTFVFCRSNNGKIASVFIGDSSELGSRISQNLMLCAGTE